MAVAPSWTEATSRVGRIERDGREDQITDMPKWKPTSRLTAGSLLVAMWGALAPLLAEAQDPIAPIRTRTHDATPVIPNSSANLETSLRGPLQRKLQAEYPDSFRVGVDIFLEPREGWVSQEVFDWWVARVNPEGLDRSGAERLFSRISSESPVFPRDERRICAVVGASRNLLGSGYGRLIDAHDVVFRVNRAPTEDYDSDVGEKTTHHVAWPTDLSPSVADRWAFLLFNPLTLHTPNLFDWMLTLVEHELPWPADRVRIINPEFVKYLDEYWTKGRGDFPSTGLIAMMVALHVCDEVDIFGFGADAAGRWDRYYEDNPKEPTGLHPADFEGQLRQDMEERGILKVFLGNRSADGVKFQSFMTDESRKD